MTPEPEQVTGPAYLDYCSISPPDKDGPRHVWHEWRRVLVIDGDEASTGLDCPKCCAWIDTPWPKHWYGKVSIEQARKEGYHVE